jgi:hypothetical protein
MFFLLGAFVSAGALAEAIGFSEFEFPLHLPSSPPAVIRLMHNMDNPVGVK